MNKKRLSVVMAGAMLATSVAPVMAAETEAKEVSVSGLAIYANTIKEKMNESLINAKENTTIYGASTGTATDFVSAAVSTKAYSMESAYGVKVNGAAAVYGIENAVNAIKGAQAGAKIEIVKHATTDFHGFLIPGTQISGRGTEASDKYTENDFGTGFSTLKSTLEASDYVKLVEVNEDKKSATVTLEALDENGKNKTLTIKVDDAKLNINLPMSGDKLLYNPADTDNIQKCDGFMKEQNWVASEKVEDAETVVETINVVADVDATVEKVDTSDLYDGTILTSKGTEILNDLKNDKAASNNTYVKLVDDGNNGVDSLNGVNSFEVHYFVKGDTSNPVKTIKVSSTKKAETIALYNLLKGPNYTVGIVGGSNRYATAVNVAKEQGAKIDGDNKNIVLVNGNSLVDGLSAAPLAATINGNKGTNVAAPVLLSKADSLPEETKAYLNELAPSMVNKKDVTVTLVGGEAVLTDSLVNELEAMGFKVDRLGGDNREETSLEVAREIKNETTAFVVGANGEADAMSISAVAANKKAPIIVSKIGGLSEDALKFLGRQSGDAIIVGGEAVVSKDDEEKINEAKKDFYEAVRIAGANRTETNAKIINMYYTDGTSGIGLGKGVVIAKDGSNNKEELVDALTSANIGAPIVLANSKVSDGQLNAVLKADAKTKATKVMQVGDGLDSSIIKSVAKALNLSNK